MRIFASIYRKCHLVCASAHQHEPYKIQQDLIYNKRRVGQRIQTTTLYITFLSSTSEAYYDTLSVSLLLQVNIKWFFLEIIKIYYLLSEEI